MTTPHQPNTSAGRLRRRLLQGGALACLLGGRWPSVLAQGAAAPLRYQVFTAKRPGLNRDVPPGVESLQWVANSATLIYGEREAILVDTFLTTRQNEELADAIARTGRTLVAVYATHAHGDHFFGLGVLKQRFPQVQLWATPAVAAAMKVQSTPEKLDARWRKLFPGQIPAVIETAQPMVGDTLQLEGQALVAVQLGHTDTNGSTCLHVPSIGLVVAGDAVYNGIHPFMVESTRQNRPQWLAALDKIAALRPRAVVAGHKVPDNDDDPRCIAETRRYIEDFIRLNDATSTAPELYQRMLALYPARANPGSLWSSAIAAKAEAAVSSSPEMRLGGERVSLPLVMVREFPFVEASIAGVAGKLMLDTGSQEALSVNTNRVPVSVGQALGTAQYGSGQRYAVHVAPEVRDIRVADLRYDRVTNVDAHEAAQLERITPDFIGWLGFHYWEGYALKMDYRNLRATFYRAPTDAYLQGEALIAALPFEQRRRPNIPVMPALMGEVSATAVFDTGQYGGLYLDADTKQKMLRAGLLVPAGDDTYDLAQLAIGGHVLPGMKGIGVYTGGFPPAQATGVTDQVVLSIGYALLKNYKSAWDFNKKMIYLLQR